MGKDGNDTRAASAEVHLAPRAFPATGPGRPVGQVRGILAQQVVISTPLDPFLSLRALSGYSGLSSRTLRNHLLDPGHPLPCYRIGGKIVVRRSEFDLWIGAYRQTGRADVGQIVADVLKGLQIS